MTGKSDTKARIRIAEAHKILRLVYSAERLRLYVTRHDSPRPISLRAGSREPDHLDVTSSMRIEDLEPSDLRRHLGQGCPMSTAVITVTDNAPRTAGPRWAPRSMIARAAYGASPLVFSQVKHLAETLQRYRHGVPHAAIAAATEAPTRNSTLAPAQVSLGRPAIILAVNWFEMGGAEHFAFDCVHTAIERGFHVIILPDRPSSHDHFSDLLPDHVTVFRTDLHCDDALYERLVLALLARTQIAAIHIHHSHRMYAVLPLLERLPRRPVVIDTTHIVENSNDCFVAASGTATDLIDHHHVISDNLRRTYRSRFRRTSDVHLGYLAPPFIERPLDDFGVAHVKPAYAIGFVGRMTFQKRPFVFVYLAARLIKRERPGRPSYTFTMIGDGILLDRTIALAKRLGIADRIAFLGRVKDTAAAMAGLDVVILPSANEGLTLVAYEAWDAGVLPIASDVGAQSELIPRDLLGPASPFAFIDYARRMIERLCRDKSFAEDQVNAFRMKRQRLAKQPSGRDVVAMLYGKALHNADGGANAQFDIARAIS